MSGHVEKHGKSWRFKIAVGRVNGRTQYHRKGGFSTKGEAEKAMRAALVEQDSGTFVIPVKQSVKEYFQEWLNDTEQRVRFNTFKKYRWLTTCHVIPRLGHIDLNSVQPRHLQNLYREVQTGIRPLSKRSVLHLHNMIHLALERAVKWGMIPRNVSKAVDAPRPTNAESTLWTMEELKKFLSAARSSRYFVVFLLAVMTGARKAEIAALRWQDIDFRRSCIDLKRSLVYVGKEPRFEPLKTDRSRRTIPIDQNTLCELRRHRNEQAGERLQKGRTYHNHDLVSCREDGTPLSYLTLRNHWSKAIRDAAVPRMRIHDLRHLHATMLIDQGTPVNVVSERLGHARTSITMDIYVHSNVEQQYRVADAFAQSVFEVSQEDKSSTP